MKKIFSSKGMALFIAAFVAVLLISACQPSGTPTLSPEQIAQSVASTQQAAATQQYVETLIAKLDELTNQPTWTPLPTYTPYPTPTNPPAPTAVVGTATPQPTQVYGGKCYQMEFLGDVNYPPDTVVKPGETFTKQWRVRNTGTCTWTTDFDVIFVWGDKIGGIGDITKDIKPGDEAILSAPVVAPQTPGTYMAYWMVTDNQGARFGYGPGGDYSLAIKIQVAK